MAKAKPQSRRSPKQNPGKDAPTHVADHGPWSWRPMLAAIVAVVLVFLSIGAVLHFTRSPPPEAGELAFVGSETCAGCHQPEAGLWRTSQHKHAMDHATEKSVLGDFSGVTFDYHGVQSRFFRRDGKYFVETDGPDGKLGTFEVKYTFGLDPLQQYLIEFPDGRVQALTIAWDSRPKDKGGQRWFHLYPNENIRHDDVLHWTRLNQNWNFMCAECHSTGVHKNYDAATDRFATTWAEISVGCEACHGPGSRHVGWAREQQSWWRGSRPEDPKKGLVVQFDERRDSGWVVDEKTGKPRRSIPLAETRKEVETCGLCHARRGVISEDWIPGRSLSDTHIVSPLSRGLYHADGQMLDEVYNYGSFKQSRMFAAGVTCSDCHEPHSAKLRLPGDGVCLQCHTAERYNALQHHRHEGAAANVPGCVSCHMPTSTYMVIDQRHDHSFRIPRPDQSARLGTPNACNNCHTDKSPQWAAAAIERWHGSDRKGFQKYADAFHAAWTNRTDAAALLAAIASDPETPGFARAGALRELAQQPSFSIADPGADALLRRGLADPDPMVRLGAINLLSGVPGQQAWPLIAPLLSDPNRGVRIAAASALAAVPSQSQPQADRERFDRAADEFVAAQRLNADRPEARTALGGYFARRGRPAEAEAEFKAALRLSPEFSPAAISLADLYRQLGRNEDGQKVLQAAIEAAPTDAGLHHANGLALIRLKQTGAALEELKRATELEPDRSRYAYVYAVGLHSAGRRDEAVAILKQATARNPSDVDTLRALVNYGNEMGDYGTALEYAERLLKVTPGDRALVGLISRLKAQLAPSPPP